MKTVSFDQAMKDPTLPVGVMIPVSASSVPKDLRYEPWMRVSSAWTEIGMRLHDCVFGCKTYVRRQGCTIRYGVLHSLTYGHSHSPNAR